MSPLDIHTTIRKATRLEFHPPKSKHLLALKNMTLDEPASIDDILILLEKRLNERSWIITFKVFIILHYLMREGNCVRVVDAVIKKPSVLDASKIKQKTQTQKDIENIYMYKNYIDERIVAFRHTRRDYAANEAKFSTIRRNSAVGGRRLSHITVKEGLLKEMKALQRQLDAILQCKFNMEDSKKASEITSFAFRMVLDDLLTLFQSVNEGVCNILDHYFKMKKSDAQTALGIYKRFAHQTELTMDYLNHVQMIQSELQVRDIPSQIEHAPLSMTAALEDHLLKAKDEDMEEVWQKDKATNVNGGKDATQQVSGQPRRNLEFFADAFQQQTVPISANFQQNTTLSSTTSPPLTTPTTAPLNPSFQQFSPQYAQEQPQQQPPMQKSFSEPQQQLLSQTLLDDAFSVTNRNNRPLRDIQMLRQASMPNFTTNSNCIHLNTTTSAISPSPSPTNISTNPFASMSTVSNMSSYDKAGPYNPATAMTLSLTDSRSTINSTNSFMTVDSTTSDSGLNACLQNHHHHNPFRTLSLNNSSTPVTPLYSDDNNTFKNINPFFPASPPLTPNKPINATFWAQLQQQPQQSQQQVKSPNNNPFLQMAVIP